MSAFGLSENTIEVLETIFKQYPKIDKVLLFGSRALEHYHEGSDIDLAIFSSTMNPAEFAELWDAIDSLPLIYKIDCLHFEAIANEALRHKIQETGKLIWISEA